MTREKFKIDFFVVGAARCGTTSLYHYLKQHPQVYLPNIKELNHFSKVESSDKEDYILPKDDTLYHTKIIKKFDDYRALYNQVGANRLKGDISPSYLWKKETAVKIYNHNPEAKIVVSLRNPVHRAFSHYLMNVSVGYEASEDFNAALMAERKDIWGGGNLFLEWSSYYDALQTYVDTFGRDRVLVLVFEDWIKDKKTMLKNLFSFLEIDPNVSIDLDEQFNQKKGYKHLKTLNFLRKPSLKQPLKKLLPKDFIDSLKNSLFKPQDIEEQLSIEKSEELHAYFFEEVKKLEDLTGIPLLQKWGFTKHRVHD